MRGMGKGLPRSALLAALLLIFLTSQAFAAALPTLKLGSKGDAVYSLQKNLYDKGYFSAKVITSAYTSALKKAVGVFQIANSIKPKYGYGNADEQTQNLAMSDDAVTYPQYVEKLTDAQLKPGGSGAYVKKAQTRLKSLGFYTGKIDSKYRATTTAAVKDFQTANGLSSTGIANSATREVLYESPSVITRAMYDAMNYITPLSVGSSGEQVRQLQQRLYDLGYYWGDINGEYNTQTKYSVKFFQEANGFSANGSASRVVRVKANTADAVTWSTYTKNMDMIQLTAGCKPGVRVALLQFQLLKLGYYKSVISGSYTSATTTAVRTFQIFNDLDSKYVTGKANTATRAKLKDAKAITYDEVCGSDTLKIGSGDTDAVKKLQARLVELGYYKGTVNGVYDNGVASAVKLFQQCNEGLYPTGIAYTNTLAALYSSSAKSYTNTNIEKLIKIAKSKYGCEYTSGRQGPNQFDCSGFTYYCLKQMGVNVSAEVQSQGRMMLKLGQKITYYKDLKPGDIVYFWSPDHQKKPGHAGIYVETKGKEYRFIHASSTYDKVTISNMNTDYYLGDDGAFLYGVRIWE